MNTDDLDDLPDPEPPPASVPKHTSVVRKAIYGRPLPATPTNLTPPPDYPQVADFRDDHNIDVPFQTQPKPLPIKSDTPALPFNEEMEQCALGSMICGMDCAQIAVEELEVDDFYLGKHQTLFRLLKELVDDGIYIDEYVVHDELAIRKILEQVGGRDYIGRMVFKAKGGTNVEEYCYRVRQYAKRRAIILTSNAISAASASGKGDLYALTAQMSEIESKFTPSQTVRILEHDFMISYNAENDENNLLGQRWLTRGGSCLWVGRSGLGKSSLTMQASLMWAIGADFFGVKPITALRSTIVQNENDDGDISAMYRGVINGCNLAGHADTLRENMKIIRETKRTGDEFILLLKRIIVQTKPDLLWIDNLNSYCGCSVNDQEKVAHFCRTGLGALANDTGTGIMLIHHDNKPSRDPKHSNQKTTIGDRSYAFSGHNDIINWSRAMVSLEEKCPPEGSLEALNGERQFELCFAKRGEKSGLIDSQGNTTQSIYLKHGQKPDIYWRRAVSTEVNAVSKDQQNAEEIIAMLEAGKHYKTSEIRKIVSDELGVKAPSTRVPGRPAHRIFELVCEMTKHPQMPGFHVKR